MSDYLPQINRKNAVLDSFNGLAIDRDMWIERNRYFYDGDYKYMRFLVPPGSRILDLGCGTGRLLNELRPSQGVGIDFSPNMIEIARKQYPEYEFLCADIEDKNIYGKLNGPFDVVILSDTIGVLGDIQGVLTAVNAVCDENTRVIISYYSNKWEPVLSLASLLGRRMPQIAPNYLSAEDMENFLYLSGFDVIKKEWRQLIPMKLLGLGEIINRYIAPLPFIRRLCLRNYVVARPLPGCEKPKKIYSASVLIPCRNEKGNVEQAIKRLPKFCDDIEIIFVEGHSQDGTLDEIKRVAETYSDMDIKYVVQDGKGKGDAVRKGFSLATRDVLMILDGDLTTPPEDMPKFYNALVEGKGEFINGSRLIYPLEKQAMRFLNMLANQAFSWLFTWLLNQRFTDTLCGTKVLFRNDYLRIQDNRSYFGNFDPFGDFDLIFGAVKLNLKVAEVPVNYASRRYGETQISRFSHGFLLLRMVIYAFRKFKAF